MVPLFCLYIAFVVFCMLNIMTGIFVENANSLIAKDEDRMLMEHAVKRKEWAESVQRLFCKFGEGDSNEIDFDQFAARLEDERVVAYLEKIGLEVSNCTAKGLFATLDIDGDGVLDPGEFAVTLQHLHGPARSLDLYQMKQTQKKMGKHIQSLLKQLEEINSWLSQSGFYRLPQPGLSSVAVPNISAAATSKHLQPPC